MFTSKFKCLLNSIYHSVFKLRCSAPYKIIIVTCQHRIKKLAPKPAFVTLKDLKDNFSNRPQCRLINPVKSEIGIVSKHVLDRINRDVIEATIANQCKNTNFVITWFNTLPDKDNCLFFQFIILEILPPNHPKQSYQVGNQIHAYLQRWKRQCCMPRKLCYFTRIHHEKK